MDQFQQVMAQFVGISETNNFCFRSFSLKSIFQPLKQLISIFWTLLRRGQRTYCNHYVIAQKWSKLLRYNERISFHVTGIIKWLFCLKKITFIKNYYEGDTKLVKFTMTLDAWHSFILKDIIVIFFLGTWYYVKLKLIDVLCCFRTF